MYNLRKIFLLLTSTLLLAGCASTAHFPDNPPLQQATSPEIKEIKPGENEILLLLTFSGGGSRASAFSYGVLQALAETAMPDQRRLLDEVDLISSVSGGSITAAYYGLYGDRLFSDFKSRFLERDVESELKSITFSPSTLNKLSSPTYGTGDMLDEYFNKTLYADAKIARLFDDDGPYIQINASDLFKGGRFGFTPDQFSLICSDPQAFQVSRAVAASCAVPLLFTPITLYNRAGSCGYVPSPWFYGAIADEENDLRRFQRAQLMAMYLDQPNHPYIHLLDGGLSDNLGLRAIIDRLVEQGGFWQTLKHFHQERARQIVMIVVDAASSTPSQWDRDKRNPPDTAVLDAATTIPLVNYNFETLEYLRGHLPAWQEEVRQGQCKAFNSCQTKPIYLIVLKLSDITDPALRDELTQIPTGFTLPPGSADKLIEAGHKLLHNHPEYLRLQKTLGRAQ